VPRSAAGRGIDAGQNEITKNTREKPQKRGNCSGGSEPESWCFKKDGARVIIYAAEKGPRVSERKEKKMGEGESCGCAEKKGGGVRVVGGLGGGRGVGCGSLSKVLKLSDAL